MSLGDLLRRRITTSSGTSPHLVSVSHPIALSWVGMAAAAFGTDYHVVLPDLPRACDGVPLFLMWNAVQLAMLRTSATPDKNYEAVVNNVINYLVAKATIEDVPDERKSDDAPERDAKVADDAESLVHWQLGELRDKMTQASKLFELDRVMYDTFTVYSEVAKCIPLSTDYNTLRRRYETEVTEKFVAALEEIESIYAARRAHLTTELSHAASTYITNTSQHGYWFEAARAERLLEKIRRYQHDIPGQYVGEALFRKLNPHVFVLWRCPFVRHVFNGVDGTSELCSQNPDERKVAAHHVNHWLLREEDDGEYWVSVPVHAAVYLAIHMPVPYWPGVRLPFTKGHLDHNVAGLFMTNVYKREGPSSLLPVYNGQHFRNTWARLPLELQSPPHGMRSSVYKRTLRDMCKKYAVDVKAHNTAVKTMVDRVNLLRRIAHPGIGEAGAIVDGPWHTVDDGVKEAHKSMLREIKGKVLSTSRYSLSLSHSRNCIDGYEQGTGRQSELCLQIKADGGGLSPAEEWALKLTQFYHANKTAWASQSQDLQQVQYWMTERCKAAYLKGEPVSVSAIAEFWVTRVRPKLQTLRGSGMPPVAAVIANGDAEQVTAALQAAVDLVP